VSAVAVALAALPAAQSAQAPEAEVRAAIEARSAHELVRLRSLGRFEEDLQAVRTFRPGYAFWQYVFRIPDGSIAFGSALDGRLLAVFPTGGNWSRDSVWTDDSLAGLLSGVSLPRRLSDRRDRVAELLKPVVGPVVDNPTRGEFVTPNAARYGQFLDEWARIYERFGVPSELGLAQGLVESGLNGTVRSEARAIGFCQWLSRNWTALKRLSPHVIEGYNQTTQAPYCAAYLSVLATKYGSFIPALSEHHAGGTNVGRAIDNGSRIGGGSVREYYFIGATFTRDLREISPRRYRDVYGTYGPRSFYYTEMVFGNMFRIREIRQTVPQAPIYAMRPTRALLLAEVTSRTGLSVDEVRRYNPALIRQVPAYATLYLPEFVPEFGADVAFWRRDPTDAYVEVLADFLNLDRRPEEWDRPSFVPVLERFQQRFRQTGTEEGTVMATILGYAVDEILTSGRGAILEEFRTDPEVRRLFERAVGEWKAAGLADTILIQ